MTPEIKTILGAITVILTIVGYIPYFRDIFQGKTKPHLYSWLVWGIFGILIFIMQVQDNAGSGSWMMASASMICVMIAGLAIKYGTKNITKIDNILLIGTSFAILTWLLVKDPILSLILICVIDASAFIPTIRKSWSNPYEESISFYAITAFRYGLSIFALTNYTLDTVLFLLMWLLLNTSFIFLLIGRRYKIQKQLS